MASSSSGAQSNAPFVVITIYKIKAVLSRAVANTYYSLHWRDTSKFDATTPPAVVAENTAQPAWLNVRHSLSCAKAEVWPSPLAGQPPTPQSLALEGAGRVLTVKLWEKGSGGLFSGGDTLLGEALFPLSRFLFSHCRTDRTVVQAPLLKKDANKGELQLFAESTGTAPLLDALQQTQQQGLSLIPLACEALVDMSRVNKLKLQQYLSTEMLELLANLTITLCGDVPSEAASPFSSSSKSKKKSKQPEPANVADEPAQKAAVLAVWQALVEQELRKTLISNGFFRYLKQFLRGSSETLTLTALDYCKPFFTVASHQRELVAQGIAAQLIVLLQSATLPDRVRSKALDCLLYFDAPLHADLLQLGLGLALLSLLAHITAAPSLRLRCLELLIALDAKQQLELALDKDSSLLKTVIGLLDLSGPLRSTEQMQAKAVLYISLQLAPHEPVLQALVENGVVQPIVSLLAASTAASLRSTISEFISKYICTHSQYRETLLFKTDLVYRLATLLASHQTQQLALQLLDNFTAPLTAAVVDPSLAAARRTLLLLPAKPAVASETLPHTIVVSNAEESTPTQNSSAPSATATEFPPLLRSLLRSIFDNLDSELVKKLQLWRITAAEVEEAEGWPLLLLALQPNPDLSSQLKNMAQLKHPLFDPILQWMAEQDWASHTALIKRLAPAVLSLVHVRLSETETIKSNDIAEMASENAAKESSDSEKESMDPEVFVDEYPISLTPQETMLSGTNLEKVWALILKWATQLGSVRSWKLLKAVLNRLEAVSFFSNQSDADTLWDILRGLGSFSGNPIATELDVCLAQSPPPSFLLNALLSLCVCRVTRSTSLSLLKRCWTISSNSERETQSALQARLVLEYVLVPLLRLLMQTVSQSDDTGSEQLLEYIQGIPSWQQWLFSKNWRIESSNSELPNPALRLLLENSFPAFCVSDDRKYAAARFLLQKVWTSVPPQLQLTLAGGDTEPTPFLDALVSTFEPLSGQRWQTRQSDTQASYARQITSLIFDWPDIFLAIVNAESTWRRMMAALYPAPPFTPTSESIWDVFSEFALQFASKLLDQLPRSQFCEFASARNRALPISPYLLFNAAYESTDPKTKLSTEAAGLLLEKWESALHSLSSSLPHCCHALDVILGRSKTVELLQDLLLRRSKPRVLELCLKGLHQLLKSDGEAPSDTLTSRLIELAKPFTSDYAAGKLLPTQDMLQSISLLLETVPISCWLQEGNQVYTKKPPTLSSVLSKARSSLQKSAPQSRSAASNEATVQKPPAEETASTKVSDVPAAPQWVPGTLGSPSAPPPAAIASSVVAANAKIEKIPDEVKNHSNVISTWFNSVGIRPASVGFKLLFDSKNNIPSNSTLINNIAGLKNVFLLIRSRSGFRFGAFTSLGIPAGTKASSPAGSVRDMQAFLFSINRPRGPPQPQKFGIKYSEGNSAVSFNQHRGPLAFGAADLTINLDSAVDKVKVGTVFSYQLPYSATQTFFAGSTYVDFEQLWAYQVVDSANPYKDTAPEAVTSSTSSATPAAAVPSVDLSSSSAGSNETSTLQDIKAQKYDVTLMDRRLTKAIKSLFHLHVSHPDQKWHRSFSANFPIHDCADLKKAIKGKLLPLSMVSPGPRFLMFQTSQKAIFGVKLSSSTIDEVNDYGWFTDEESQLFSLVHGSKGCRDALEPAIKLSPAAKATLGHIFVSDECIMIGQGADLYVDPQTGDAHSNPGKTYRLPDNIIFQSSEAHLLLTGESQFVIESVEVWVPCPSDLLPAEQRPVLPQLSSLLSLLASSVLVDKAAVDAFKVISSTVKSIMKKISAVSERRALQVEEELLRLTLQYPVTKFLNFDCDSETFPWKSPLINALLELRYPGVVKLPFLVSSPPTDAMAVQLTSGTGVTSTDGNEDMFWAPFAAESGEATLRLMYNPADHSARKKYVTHLLIETRGKIEGRLSIQQTQQAAIESESAPSEPKSPDSISTLSEMCEAWYKQHHIVPVENMYTLDRASGGSNVTNEAELAATATSPDYDILQRQPDNGSTDVCVDVSPVEFDLPSFVTSTETVSRFATTTEDEAISQSSSAETSVVLVTLPCPVIPLQITLRLIALDQNKANCGLKQITVIGIDEAATDRNVPPLPQSIGGIAEAFLVPHRPTRSGTQFHHNCEYAYDGDSNGVFYLLGTMDTESLTVRDNPWENPFESNVVSIKLSHSFYNKTTMTAATLTARPGSSAGVTCFFGGTAPTWFIIDMKNFKLKLTNFTLRHGYHYDNSFPTDVVMFGANLKPDAESVESDDWEILWSSQQPIFEKSFQSKTFSAEAASHYRFFKFEQKGNYTMGKSNAPGAPFIPLCGMEFYGDLVYDPPALRDSES